MNPASFLLSGEGRKWLICHPDSSVDFLIERKTARRETSALAACENAPGRDQDLALAHMIRRAHDGLLLHPLDQARSAVVADLQMPLDKADGHLVLAQDEGESLGIEVSFFFFFQNSVVPCAAGG